jgi:hypothetical protein
MNPSVKLDDRIDPKGFHAIGRTTSRAEVTIRVAYDEFPRDVALEFGLGDAGRPVPVLTKPYTRERLLQAIEDVVTRDV